MKLSINIHVCGTSLTLCLFKKIKLALNLPLYTAASKTLKCSNLRVALKGGSRPAAAARRISFFYLRVVNDAARWLAAGSWLVLHPAGRRSHCSVSAPPVIPGTAIRCSHTLPHAHAPTHTHSWVCVACVRHTGCSNPPTSPEWALRGTLTTEQCAHTALRDSAGCNNFCTRFGGNRCKRACHHHGLSFSSDLDFTHPAGQLHLTQAPVHPLFLEYYQGMWHIHDKSTHQQTYLCSRLGAR